MPALVAAPADAIERTCKICGETKPIDLFALAGKGRLYKCKVCRNRQRVETEHRRREAGELLTSSTEREQRSRRRAAFGHGFVESAPDPAPARLLAELLNEDRALGFALEAVWAEDVDFVLGLIRKHNGVLAARAEWREVFEATRTAWEAAWLRQPGPGFRLSRELIDALVSS